jgi:P pilus assembly chaperone PapD
MWSKVLPAVALACALTGLGGAAADAMSVSPMQVEMASAGSLNHNQIVVTNDSALPLPVATSVARMQLDINGKRKMSKAGDAFLVFPPQALIPPGGKQVFRLQWVGEPALARGESYVFTVSQVPVKLAKGPSKIEVITAFGVIVNVAAAGAHPVLNLVETSVAKDKQGRLRPVLTVENPTNSHALLPDATISLSGNGWSKTLAPGEIRNTMGLGLVQPGMRRRFVLPLTVPATAGNLRISMDYHPKH